MFRALAPVAIAVSQQLTPVPLPLPEPANPPAERETLSRYHVNSGEELLAAMIRDAKGHSQAAASDLITALCMPGDYEARKTLAGKLLNEAGLPDEVQRVAKGQQKLPDGRVKFLREPSGATTENVLDVSLNDKMHPCPNLYQIIVFEQRVAPGKVFLDVAQAGISPRDAVFTGEESDAYILSTHVPQRVNLEQVFKARDGLTGEGVVFRIRISVGNTTETLYLDKATGQVVTTDLKTPNVSKDNYGLIVPFTHWATAISLQQSFATKPTVDELQAPKVVKELEASK